jgi:hypothetical protein
VKAKQTKQSGTAWSGLCLATLLLAACGGGGGGDDGSGGGGGGGTGTAPPPPAPTVTLSVSPTTAMSGGSIVVTWSSQNATSCTASGVWSGSKATSGSETLTAGQSSGSYGLTCTGAGGSAQQTAALSVTQPGVVSYNQLSVVPNSLTATQYDLQIRLAAFNSTSLDAATLAALRTASTNLSVPGTGTSTLGQQTYALNSISCAQPGASNAYSALMLFDRSGSMSGNDPNDDTLSAAREFINRMTSLDQGWVAAFPGGTATRPVNPVTFYGAAFTTDRAQLLANVVGVGAPSGDTPLWDSANLSVAKFPAGASATNKALLVFSDGADTASTNSSASVTAAALARGVRVFAVNLRNSNSQQLDEVALATGGSVYSTSDARRLVAFYGTLGKLLSGQAINCTATIRVTFAANAGMGEVGYGPGTSTKLTLEFEGTSQAGAIIAPTEITFPFYPGRKTGQSTVGNSVYETDDIDGGNSSSCFTSQAGPVLRNNCTNPLWVAVCNAAAPTTCRRGVVQPGATIQSYASVRFATCPWREPFDKYEAVGVTGTSPAATYSSWNGGFTQYSCVNTARGPF